MATSGGQPGNQNAAKGSRWRNAIEAALKKRCKSDGQKALVKIAEQLLEKAEQGDISALKELGDRMDGRAAQQLIHSGDQDQPIRTVTDVNITSLDEGGD